MHGASLNLITTHLHRIHSALPSEQAIDDLVGELIASLAENPSNRHSIERTIQQRLNRGELVTEEAYTKLQEAGYAISHNPETIVRFRNFQLEDDPELAHALRGATVEGGLLVDGVRMYYPGPASVLSVGGAAKGYEEAYAVHDQQARAQQFIIETIACHVQTLLHNLPVEVKWKKPINLLYAGCGNEEQFTRLGSELNAKMPEQVWQMICVEREIQSPSSSSQQPFVGYLNHRSFQGFSDHDLLQPFPKELHGRVELIIISDPYFLKNEVPVVIDRLKQLQARNALVVIIEEVHHSDSNQTFVLGNASKTMSAEFEEAFKEGGYQIKERVEESFVKFPPLSPEIRDEILKIKRGDYENPYTDCSDDFHIFKGLIEYYVGLPLEAMTVEERLQLLEKLEAQFNLNEGYFLRSTYRILFTCPDNSKTSFKNAFNAMYENGVDVNIAFRRIEELMFNAYYREAGRHLPRVLEKLYRQWDTQVVNGNSWSQVHIRKFLDGLTLLAEIKLKEGFYAQAAAILFYAKRIEALFGINNPTPFHVAIENVERVFLAGGTDNEVVIGGMEQAESNQAALRAIREELKERFEAIEKAGLPPEEKVAALRAFTHEIAQRMKDFIAGLINECIMLLEQVRGNPPCEFAIVAMGPLANVETMTPYSNFSFAIVTETEEEHHKQYFRDLNILFNIALIKFEESPISSFDVRGISWLPDMLTPHGISFDKNLLSASQPPRGRKTSRQG